MTIHLSRRLKGLVKGQQRRLVIGLLGFKSSHMTYSDLANDNSAADWIAWLATCLACLSFFDHGLFEDITYFAILAYIGKLSIPTVEWPTGQLRPLGVALSAIGTCVAFWLFQTLFSIVLD